MVEANACLPEDTLVLILSMLPVKSLVRFRSVSKLWYQIISGAYFINAHRKNTKDKYLLCTHYNFHALVSKEDFTNYGTCDFSWRASSQDFIDYKLYCYTPMMFREWYDTVKVYACCNGLLCLTDGHLEPHVDIFLLNPVIRKVKTIPKIPVELYQDAAREVKLCFGYFDDDYKLIRISSCRGIFWVGVYSLRTDCWRIINCGQCGKFDFLAVPSICVGGVAYFVGGMNTLLCFDLCHEKIDQIPIPKMVCIRYGGYDDIFMEACGESIALMQIRDEYLEKWVLENRHPTTNDSYTWKKQKMMKVTCMESEAPYYVPIDSSGVGTFSLMDNTSPLNFNLYVCGNPELISKVEGFGNINLPFDLIAIDFHMGNLVLLNEQTLEPLLKQETETRSTRSMLIFYRFRNVCD